MKTKKCNGCGALLQSGDKELEGYIEGDLYESATICKRCFRLKYYNDYEVTKRDNEQYTKILKDINTTKDLVLYVVDIFNLNHDMNLIFDHVKNDVLLVITKQDILPKSVKEFKLVDYFLNDKRFIDVVVVSSNKNYHFDKLYKMIMHYKTSSNIYVVGKTNAGKSTLINKFIKNYSIIKHDITTSYLPSTTLDTIKIKLTDDLTLIDTPGIIDKTDIINYLSLKDIKLITPKKEIKPVTYQIDGEMSIIVEPFVRVDTNCESSFTFYMANELGIRRNSYKNDKLKEFKPRQIEVPDNSDVVVNGLLWIKVTKGCSMVIYTYDEVLIYIRDSII